MIPPHIALNPATGMHALDVAIYGQMLNDFTNAILYHGLSDNNGDDSLENPAPPLLPPAERVVEAWRAVASKHDANMSLQWLRSREPMEYWSGFT